MNKTDQSSIPVEMIPPWTDTTVSELQSFASGLYNSVCSPALDGNEYILRTKSIVYSSYPFRTPCRRYCVGV